MSFHNGEFFGSKSARLIQDLIRNGDLANVMKGRRCTDNADLFLADGIGIFFHLNQMTQKHICDHLNMKYVKSALTISKFYNMGEDIDHQLVAFLTLINLIAYNTLHALLFSIEQNGICDTPANHVHIKWLADKVCHPKVVTSLDIGG